jgi:MFS family permease
VNAVFGCLPNFMLTGYQAILLVFLVRSVAIAPGTAGVLLALASVGGVVGAAFARRIARVFGSARGWLICKLGLAPFGLLIPLTTSGAGLALFVLGSMVMIGGIVAGNVIWSGFVQTYYPTGLLGRISTSTQFVNFGAIPLGALTAGALAEALNPRAALWIMLAGVAASACVLLLSPVRRMRDLPTSPERRDEECAHAA